MITTRTIGTLAWITSSICGTAVIVGWFTYDFPFWVLLAATIWAMSNIVWAIESTDRRNQANQGP